MWRNGADEKTRFFYLLIRIDFSQFRVTSAADLRQKLEEQITELAKINEVVCDT